MRDDSIFYRETRNSLFLTKNGGAKMGNRSHIYLMPGKFAIALLSVPYSKKEKKANHNI